MRHANLHHLAIAVCAACVGCTPGQTASPEQATTAVRGHDQRVGWIDCERILHAIALPEIVTMEHAREDLLRHAPEGFRALIEKAQTLEDQIAALPVASDLRFEKRRLLFAVQSEILRDQKWQSYVLWGAERIDVSTAILRDETEAVAKGEGLDLVLFVHVPRLDEATGMLKYDQDAPLAAAQFDPSKAREVTDLVLARLSRRFRPETPSEKHSRGRPAAGEDASAGGLAAFAKVVAFTQPDILELMAAYKGATGYDLDLHFEVGNLEPLWVRPFNAGQARWMLLLKYPGGIGRPAITFLQVHLFDADGHRLLKDTFPTGRGFKLGTVDVEHSKDLGDDTLVAHLSEDRWPGATPDISTGEVQSYALCNGRLELVRAADQHGSLVRRDFRSWFPDKGKLPPRRSVEEWQSSLRGASIREQLVALVWLTGLHLPSALAKSPDREQEDAQDSLIFENVRSSKETVRLLGELKKSPNAWVREYAELGFDSDH